MKETTEFVGYRKVGSTTGFFKQIAYPHICGKLVKCSTDSEAMDLKAKQVNFYIGQVPGYNIFIIQAGYAIHPAKLIPDFQIKSAIDAMCNWYLNNRITKSIEKKYKIKNHANI